MAIYHLHMQIITRSEGMSAVAGAAYRAGQTLKNEYDGVTHDYTKKRGVVHTEIILPENAPAEYIDRSTLWNAVEKSERYKTAQLAREFEIALPVELTIEQNISLARRFVKDTLVNAGMCADICVHDKNDGNPHFHVMLTMRPFEKDGKWAKSRTVNGRKINTVDWNDRDKADIWRKAWQDYCNAELGANGFEITIDHRSYEAQGIEQIPTVHMGAAASAMEKRGIRTERGDINRSIEVSNNKLKQIKARLNKLDKWLTETKQSTNTTPTLADVLSEMLNSDREQSHYAQIRDLKMAAKTLIFIQQNNLTTIEDLRGKVSNYYKERQAISDKLKPFERRIKTLDEHIKHSENFTKYRKIVEKRNALDAEYKTLSKQGLFSKGKAQKALEAAEAYDWKHLNALQDYDTAEKYLRGVLQKRFDPKNIPVTKWRQERETLAQEKGGLNTEYAFLKERILEVERIRKYAEEVQRAIQPSERKRDNAQHI